MAYRVYEDDASFTYGPVYQGSDPDYTIGLDAKDTIGSVTLNSDGSISYSPAGFFDSLAAGQVATDSYTYSVTTDAGTETYTVEIEVVGQNDAPVATGAIDAATVDGGSPWSLSLPAGLFVDVDGDALTYSARLVSGAALPSWLTFDPATQTFAGTPPATFGGRIELLVLASDGTASAGVSIVLDVVATAVQLTVGEDAAGVVSGPIYDGDDANAQITIESTGTAGSATLNDDGTLSYSPGDAFQALKAGETGHDTVTVTIVADGTSVTKTYEIDVIGANDAPVAGADLPSQSISTGQALHYTLPADAFVDRDGDALVLSATLASGDPLPGWLVFDPATGTFIGSPPATESGTVDVVVRASDGSAAATSVLSLHVNQNATILAVGEDGPAVAGVPINNHGDPHASFALDTSGTMGVVAFNADGTISYDPATAFQALAQGATGHDGFDVLVTAFGVTTREHYVVDVAGRNDAPTVTGAPIGPQHVDGGQAFALTLPADHFTDVDGGPPTLRAHLADGTALPGWLVFDPATGSFHGSPPETLTGTFEVVIDASDGAATGSASFALSVTATAIGVQAAEDGPAVLVDPHAPAGASIAVDTAGTAGTVVVNADGTLSYDPHGAFEALGAGETGTDSFIVRTTVNGVTTSEKYVVDVAGENDAVVASTGAFATRYLGTHEPVSVTLPDGLFSDVDGDQLHYVAYTAGGGLLPDWLVFDAATLSFSGTPPEGFSGKLDIRVQASDDTTSAKVLVPLVFSDVPQAITAIPDQSIAEEGAWSYTVPAGTFIDPNGDELTYSASLRSGAALPDWVSFDPSTGTFSGTPPTDYAGYFLFKVTASDGANATSISFRLDVTNVEDAPHGVSVTSPWIANQAHEGTIVGYLVTDDPDRGDTFTYQLIDDDSGHFRLEGDKLVVNVPSDAQSKAGVRTVTVRSTDAAGHSVDSQIQVQVQKTDHVELFANNRPTHTVWVAKTGSDTDGDGSAEHPFGTIQHALDLATPGAAIMVKAGVYNEALVLVNSGTTDHPISLISADGAGAAVIQPIAKPEVNAFSGRGIQNYVIDGFAITGSDTRGTYGFNLVSINNGAAGSYQDGYGGTKVANIVIKNNIITNWGIDGIHIAQSVGVQVLNNIVSGAHEQGIDFVTATNVRIAGNTVDNITRTDAWKGLDTREYTGDAGISVKGGSIGVFIENNVIGKTGGYAIKLGDPTGLAYLPITDGADGDGGHYYDFEVQDAIVRGNTALQSALGSVQVNAAQDVVIDQNRITTILIKSYDRANNLGLSGIIDAFLPGGMSALADNITISRNVYSAAKLYNTFNGVTIHDTGDNVVYSDGVLYSPAQWAWVGGTSGGAATIFDVINGKTMTAANPGNDVLTGDRKGIANDYIDGKTGNDIMSGGFGNDVYVVDNKNDVVHEYQGGGIDTVIVGGSYALFNLPEPVSGGDGWIENVIVTRSTFTTVNGNSLDNHIIGGSATDRIRGGYGDDMLYGAGGNDNIDGGNGNDYIDGGVGNDTLYGGDGNGIDTIDGGLGRDTMRGGGGNDILRSGDADYLIDGGYGVDLAYIDRSDATVDYSLDVSYFGSGDMAATDPRQIVLPDGTVVKNIEQVQIATGSGNDTIIGGYFADDISTGSGDDIIWGNAGNDRLWGGYGNDQIHGGEGADSIDGGPGLDSIWGDDGNDTIYSLDADTSLDGGAGFDILIAQRTSATAGMIVDFSVMTKAAPQSLTLPDGTLISGFEQVTFTSGSGDDVLTGTTGNDKLNAAKGDDIIYGGDGADTLYGGAGNDRLYGGNGADTISGDGGADILTGGAGVDTFVFKAGQAEGDVITDFEGAGKGGGDKLSFIGYGPGASLTYDAAHQQWVVSSADGSIVDHFTITGVTTLIASDYTLL